MTGGADIVAPDGRIDWQAVAAACGGDTWHTGGGCMAVVVALPGGGRLTWASEANLPLFWDVADVYGADIEDAAGDYVGSFVFCGGPHATLQAIVESVRALAGLQ